MEDESNQEKQIVDLNDIGMEWGGKLVRRERELHRWEGVGLTAGPRQIAVMRQHAARLWRALA